MRADTERIDGRIRCQQCLYLVFVQITAQDDPYRAASMLIENPPHHRGRCPKIAAVDAYRLNACIGAPRQAFPYQVGHAPRGTLRIVGVDEKRSRLQTRVDKMSEGFF